MAIQGKILAVELSRTEMINFPYPHLHNGHRYILAVRAILAKVQTTVFFGYNLYTIGPASNLDEGTIFTNFVKSYAEHPHQWAQLSQISSISGGYLYPMWQASMLPPAPPPIATAVMTVKDAGWSQASGFWIEFHGNYFLNCPIFRDWESSVERDGPNYKGFQPSQ